MSSLRGLVPLLTLASLALACSSSGGASTSDAGPDVDGALGPMLCGLPVASTCPVTAPCSFGTWACAAPACDGYQVITDGTWTYYYSLPGGELAGEVSSDDAGVEACPYGFEPQTTCSAVVAGQCLADAGESD